MKLSAIRTKSIQVVHQNRIKRQNLRVEFKLTWGESFVYGNIGYSYSKMAEDCVESIFH